MSKRRRWILLPLVALAATLIVGALFDGNWLKGPVQSLASAALDREVEIAGDLDVDLSTTPTVRLQQVRLANAPWGSRPHMLIIPEVAVAVRLSSLLRGDVELMNVRAREPDLLLETNEQGEGNWEFGPPDEPAGAPPTPIIEDLQITHAAIRYRVPGREQDLLAQLDTVAGAIAGAGLRLSAQGTLNEEPLSVRLESAPVERLEPASAAERFPFQLEARLGPTQITATGSAERLLEAEGLSVEIALESEQPEALLALAGRETPELDPLALSLGLTREGDLWSLRDIDLRLGGSDLRGDAAFTMGGEVPALSAALRSSEIRLAEVRDLVALLGGDSGPVPGRPTLEATVADAQDALEPAADVADADGLAQLEAEVSWQVARLSGPDLLVRDLGFYGGMRDRLPYLVLSGEGHYQSEPVTLAVRLGDATGQADPYPIRARIEAGATQVALEGAIGAPEALEGLDLQVQASSEDINRVLALGDIDLPPIPPFAVSGHMVQDGEVWRIADFYGQFSESDLAGELTFDLSGRRPFVSADLRSNRLLVSDLVTAGDRAAVVEAEADAAPAAEETAGVESADAGGGAEDEGQQEAALISLEGLNFDVLPEIDADIGFQGQFVAYQDFRFDQLRFDLQLRDAIVVLDASGEGQYRDSPLTFEAHLGNAQTLDDPDARYPIDVQIASEETRVSAEGSAAEPGRMAGLDVDLRLAGPNLDRLGEILQLSLPTTPPFDLQSRLSREENRWNFTSLSGTIGDSDIEGEAALVLGGARPLLEAELSSKRLDFDDLGLLVGAPADPEETISVDQERAGALAAARRGVLPDEPFDVPELRAMDARVAYRARQVQASKLPLEGVVLDLTLEDGRMTFEPLRFDLADGALDSVIRLDGRTDVLAGELELAVRNIRLNRLFAAFDIEIAGIEMEQEGVGTFAGQAALEVRGNSIRELAGSADGEALFLMDGGKINALIVEGLGLDVGEAIALLLSGDEEEQSEMVPIQCLVARFGVQDGIMQTEALVLETSDSTITGTGQIDLGQEALSIELLANPKDASVLSASTPVRIGGTFENPEIDPVSEELQEKSLAALALGVVLPVIGAILPFVEEGEGEPVDCARLIEAASAAVQTDSLDRTPQ